MLARATIELGQRDGLLPGMLLHTLEEAAGYGEGRVVAVDEAECRVEFRYPKEAQDAKALEGWLVSTRSRGAK